MTSAIPPSSAGVPPNTRLNGWKEIAAHFSRGVRTVQRWEKAFGMPVYRIGTGRGENVHAFSEELDVWLATAARSRDLRDQPGDADQPENGRNGRRTDESPAADGASGPAPPASATPRTPSRLLVLAGAVALLSLLAWRLPVAGRPSSFIVDRDTIRVLDVFGRNVFSKSFGHRLPDNKPSDSIGNGAPVILEDVDGNGSPELLMLAPTDSGRPKEFILFEASGNPRFPPRTLDASVRFGETDYRPPWSAQHIWLTDEPDGSRAIWLSWVHESGDFPCLLEEVTPGGALRSRYWSAGYIHIVGKAIVRGRPSILVGAANNDHQAASLAVFDRDRVQGSGPAEDPGKACRTCDAGNLTAFLVFPRLDVMAREGWLPSVVEIRSQSDGALRVYVSQRGWRDGEKVGGSVYYDLSPDLVPLRAGFVADYIASHKSEEKAGRLDHPFGDADFSQLWPVLVLKDGKFVPVTGTSSR
jgi:hypothetical protein